MLSLSAKYAAALLAILVLFSGTVLALSPIGTVTFVTTNGDTTPILNTESAPGAGVPFGAGEFWDITFTGVDSDISLVQVGGDDYEFVTLADSLALKRVDNANITGVRDLVYCRGVPDNATEIAACEGSTFTDMETILLGRSMNFGTDNIFSNGAFTGNNNNIERVDYIYETGINIDVPTGDIGFIVLERGGNDNFKIAPILSVNGFFEPTSYGTLLTVGSGNFGSSGLNYESMVFRRDDTDTKYRPSADLGPQNVAGVFITFADLGLAGGTTFYGYSIFPDDRQASDDLVNLTPDRLASGNGLDLVEGGGFFQKVGSGSFVDMRVTKTTSTPNPAPNAQVTYTVLVENLTQNNTIVDADFTDVLPVGEFSNVQWTCQAFVVGTTCLNGAQTANGSPSAVQSPVDTTVSDVVDIAIGGSVSYIITADLGGGATGVITNTATVVADALQTELSTSNNTDSASLTVQAPATGSKPLYFLTDPTATERWTLSRAANFQADERERINDGATETWILSPSIQAPLQFSDPLTLTVALAADDASGSRTVDYVINKVANNGAGATTKLADATSTANLTEDVEELIVATVTMTGPGPWTLAANDQIQVEITVAGGRTYIYEGVSAADADLSQLTLSPDPVINVDSITFSATPEPGDNVTITAVVSDPFGEADITDVRFDWFNPSGSLILNDQVMSAVGDADPATETFEFVYAIPDIVSSIGDWTATVTATEGFETVPVTHTSSNTVTVGAQLLPNITVVKKVNTLDFDEGEPGDQPVFAMTFTNTGPGDAEDLIVTIDIDEYFAFGVDSQAGNPFTYSGSGGLPSNFFGTPVVSINDGPFVTMPTTPSYFSGITAIRIEMNGVMSAGESFTLTYQSEIE